MNSTIADGTASAHDSEVPAEPNVTGRHSVARNASMLLASQGATWVFAVFLTVLPPRYLGPEGVGQLRLGLSLWAIAEVFNGFGTPTLLTLELARNRRRGGVLVGHTLVLQTILSVLSTAAVMAFVLVAGFDSRTIAVVAILGGGSLMNSFGATARASLYGLERMDFVALADIVGKATYFVPVVVGLVLGADARYVAAIVFLGGLVNTALLYGPLRKFPEIRFRGRLSGARALRRRTGSYLMIDASFIVYQQVDIIFISLMLNATAVGWYSSAVVLTGSLLFIPTIVMTSLFPALARLHTERPEDANTLLHRTFTSLVIIAVPIGLGATVLARPICILLFGQPFAGAAGVLAVMGLVLIVTFPTILVGRYALVAGRQRFWAGMMIASTIATIPLDVVLVAVCRRAFDNGAVGGALSYLVTESAMLAIGIWKIAPGIMNRRTGVRLAKSCVSGVLMAAAVWPARHAFIPIPILIGVAVYCGAIISMGTIDEREKALLRSASFRLMALFRRRSTAVSVYAQEAFDD